MLTANYTIYIANPTRNYPNQTVRLMKIRDYKNLETKICLPRFKIQKEFNNQKM